MEKQKLFCTDLTKGFQHSSSGAGHLLQVCIEGNLCSLKVTKTEHSVLPLARHHPFNCVDKIRQSANQPGRYVGIVYQLMKDGHSFFNKLENGDALRQEVNLLLCCYLVSPDNKPLFADASYWLSAKGTVVLLFHELFCCGKLLRYH